MKENEKAKGRENEVAAALPTIGDETEHDGAESPATNRESMVFVGSESTAGSGFGIDREVEEEEDDEHIAEEKSGPKTSKLKVLGAVAGFAVGLVVLATGVSWFFGMGVFAQAKKQNVDRTAKISNNGAGAAPVSEDEKLRMALNMVAEKSAAASTSPTPTNVSNLTLTGGGGGSISPNEKGPEPPSLALPGDNIPITSVDGKRDTQQRTSSPATSGGGGGDGSSRSSYSSCSPRSSSSSSTQTTVSQRVPPQQDLPVSVRSIFFGPSSSTTSSPSDEERADEDDSVDTGAATQQRVLTAPVRPDNAPEQIRLPFGTFLPVRILGAVYAVQNSSGSLVRMELSQAVETGEGEGGAVQLPAGTLLVGRVKGSELNRIMVSVVGLIDPSTGGLVSFDAEVVGGDGAAGVPGKRRSVRSGWSKLLAGLREAGSTALGALGGIRRGGGAVVIADRAAGSMGADVAEIIRRDRVSEYVEVPAGTTAFVLVTELPREVSETFRSASVK